MSLLSRIRRHLPFARPARLDPSALISNAASSALNSQSLLLEFGSSRRLSFSLAEAALASGQSAIWLSSGTPAPVRERLFYRAQELGASATLLRFSPLPVLDGPSARFIRESFLPLRPNFSSLLFSAESGAPGAPGFRWLDKAALLLDAALHCSAIAGDHVSFSDAFDLLEFEALVSLASNESIPLSARQPILDHFADLPFFRQQNHSGLRSSLAAQIHHSYSSLFDAHRALPSQFPFAFSNKPDALPWTSVHTLPGLLWVELPPPAHPLANCASRLFTQVLRQSFALYSEASPPPGALVSDGARLSQDFRRACVGYRIGPRSLCIRSDGLRSFEDALSCDTFERRAAFPPPHVNIPRSPAASPLLLSDPVADSILSSDSILIGELSPSDFRSLSFARSLSGLQPLSHLFSDSADSFSLLSPPRTPSDN